MKKCLVLGVALIFFIIGCATLMENREKMVGVASLAHDAVLILAPLALDAEKITQAEYDEIVDKANKFKEAVDVVDEALTAYARVDSAENQKKLDVAIAEVMKLLPEIQRIIIALRE